MSSYLLGLCRKDCHQRDLRANDLIGKINDRMPVILDERAAKIG